MRRSPALQWSILVAIIDVVTLSTVVWGVFRPWASIYDGPLFLIIVFPLAALTAFVLWKRDRYLVLPPWMRPVSVGLVGLALCLFPPLANQLADLSFVWNRGRFEAAVAKIETLIKTENEPVWLDLPAGLEYLASDGKVVGVPGNGEAGWMMLFPESAEDFDGFFSGVMYVSDDADRHVPEVCLTSSPLFPGSRAWYSCVVNRVHMPRR